MSKLQIKYRDVADISILQKNFKRHALDEAEASITQRGFIDPIGFNPTTGNAFDGNGRTEAVRRMLARWKDDKASQPVPQGIVVVKDSWQVPTVDVEMTEDEEVSAAAALNQINKLGGYDEAFQLEILQEMQEKGTMAATGFGDEDLEALLKRFPAPKAPKTNPDADLAGVLGGEEGPETSGAPDSEETEGGAPLPQSTTKQVALLYAPDDHLEFMNLTMALGKPLEKDNVSDTVLAALRYANTELNS